MLLRYESGECNFEKYCKLLSNYNIFQNSCLDILYYTHGINARGIDFSTISIESNFRLISTLSKGQASAN